MLLIVTIVFGWAIINESEGCQPLETLEDNVFPSPLQPKEMPGLIGCWFPFIFKAKISSP